MAPPHPLLRRVSRASIAEGLGRSYSCQLEVSHLGGKVKRARAPQRRGHSHNEGAHTISLVMGKCKLKPPPRMAKILKIDNSKRCQKCKGIGTGGSIKWFNHYGKLFGNNN